MSKSAAKTFTAELEPLRNGLGWVIARVPFDIQKAWPVRNRLRVRGEVGGFAFRTSLFAESRGGGHFLLVNKKMQAGAKAKAGEKVKLDGSSSTDDGKIKKTIAIEISSCDYSWIASNTRR